LANVCQGQLRLVAANFSLLVVLKLVFHKLFTVPIFLIYSIYNIYHLLAIIFC